jgi:hypothetical protein
LEPEPVPKPLPVPNKLVLALVLVFPKRPVPVLLVFVFPKSEVLAAGVAVLVLPNNPPVAAGVLVFPKRLVFPVEAVFPNVEVEVFPKSEVLPVLPKPEVDFDCPNVNDILEFRIFKHFIYNCCTDESLVCRRAGKTDIKANLFSDVSNLNNIYVVQPTRITDSDGVTTISFQTDISFAKI